MSDIGKLRRSGLIGTFGPGAIVDFRVKDAAVSGIVAGLEEWDRNFPPPSTANPQHTTEPRLMRRLKIPISGFRLPPVLSDQEARELPNLRLIAAEFPKWMQCPQCDRISENFPKRPNSASRYCPHHDGADDIYVIPVRFVMACERGHLDEFPWHFWVQHRKGCNNHHGDLFLKSTSAGLAGLDLSCQECGSSRTMEGIFSEETWNNFGRGCRGRRPWLAAPDEKDCDKVLRAVQRGATNLYFPVTLSSLDIPPWSDELMMQLGHYWYTLTAPQTASERKEISGVLSRYDLKPILESMGLTPDKLHAEIEKRISMLDAGESEDLRIEEYRQFTAGQDTPQDEAHNFEIRGENIPAEIAGHFDTAVRAVRLREVRVLTGFTRIHPPAGANMKLVAPISVGNPGWLPAIEVHGEGIFLDLKHQRVKAWESRTDITKIAEGLQKKYVETFRSRYGEDPEWIPSARFYLAHTFAHALMRQLSLDCGYSSASLRERLYVDDLNNDMCGVLIYTATTDADGTLGGLQRQGRSDLVGASITAAIRSMKWCSSDPICIHGKMSAPESASGAACHGCVLAPETSCEHFNCMLERRFLVGDPNNASIGYFYDLVRTE